MKCVSECEIVQMRYKPGALLLLPKPELPELPLPPPLPAMLYGSSSGIGIRGRFFMSSGR